MAARIALGALVGAQLALASPVYGGNATTPAGGVVYTTEVVDEYTTYCPEATTLTYNDKTYTVTKPTTLTITDCPCTIKKPVKATSTSAAPAVYTTPAGGVHYTTEVVTKLTTYCPAATTLTFNDKTYTVTKPTTLTVTDCPCTIKKPIVYTTEVVTKLTTYCPEPTTLTFNNITYTVTKPTSLTVTNCPCTITKATTLPTGTSPAKPVTTLPAKTCAEECYASYNSCRSGSYANHAAFAAAYAGCLGYSPFDSNGSLVTPTACSAGATGATVPVTGTAPVAAGTTATVPGSAATTPASVPTAAAGRALPEFVLLALGALALL